MLFSFHTKTRFKLRFFFCMNNEYFTLEMAHFKNKLFQLYIFSQRENKNFTGV